MPWKEATKVNERAELIRKWKSGLYAITELAEVRGKPADGVRVDGSVRAMG
jgi:hypothetical protein